MLGSGKWGESCVSWSVMMMMTIAEGRVHVVGTR